MADDIERVGISGDRITLSLLVWRRFRRPMPGYVEATLALNPGLAGLGFFIPIGTAVDLPIPQQTETNSEPKARISLW